MFKIQILGAPKGEKNTEANIINDIIQENVQNQSICVSKLKKLTAQIGH